MNDDFQHSRQFRKEMEAQGYYYNETTKQYEQREPDSAKGNGKRTSRVSADVSTPEEASPQQQRGSKQRKSAPPKKSRKQKKRKPKAPAKKSRRNWSWKKLVLSVLALFLIGTTLFDPTFWRGGSAYGVLFVGSDTSSKRDEWKGDNYADAIIYAVVEPWKQQLTIVPINRDTVTSLACGGQEANINHAYNQGGIDCLRKTFAENFEVPVDYYVETNFNGFVDVIDALGGIEVVAEKSFCEQNSTDESDAICFVGGLTYQMTGEEALAYARHRQSDNLSGRQRRQEQVLQAVVTQVFKPTTLLRLPFVIGAVVSNVGTNISPFGSVLTLAAFLQSPTKTTVQYSGYYEVTDNYHFHPDSQFWIALEQLQAVFD